VLQLRSYDFWHLWRLFTVVTSNTNYELKRKFLLNKFPFIWRSSLKFFDQGSLFLKKTFSATNFSARDYTTRPLLPQINLDKLIIGQVAKYSFFSVHGIRSVITIGATVQRH
jgi:hypothetical protein